MLQNDTPFRMVIKAYHVVPDMVLIVEGKVLSGWLRPAATVRVYGAGKPEFSVQTRDVAHQRDTNQTHIRVFLPGVLPTHVTAGMMVTTDGVE